MKSIILLFTIFPSVLFGQTATFSADTSRFLRETRTDILEQILEAEWKINGQILHYGSEPITIETDNTLDTIYFRQQHNAKVDTLICNINKPGHFTFYYNECCGGFNTADTSGKFIVGSVLFQIQGQIKEQHYLGTLGETGVMVNTSSQDTLNPGCRSAMAPNVYPIIFSQIEVCTDTVDCNEETCLLEPGREELNYAFDFKTISKKLDCLYLPLSIQPIIVTYIPESDEIRME